MAPDAPRPREFPHGKGLREGIDVDRRETPRVRTAPAFLCVAPDSPRASPQPDTLCHADLRTTRAPRLANFAARPHPTLRNHGSTAAWPGRDGRWGETDPIDRSRTKSMTISIRSGHGALSAS